MDLIYVGETNELGLVANTSAGSDEKSEGWVSRLLRYAGWTVSILWALVVHPKTYRKLVAQLVRFISNCLGWSRTNVVVEEIAHDAFVKLYMNRKCWRKFMKLTDDGKRGYLYVVAKNAVYDVFRERPLTTESLPEDESADPEAAPRDDALIIDLRDALLARLNDSHLRTVIDLYDGRSIEKQRVERHACWKRIKGEQETAQRVVANLA